MDDWVYWKVCQLIYIKIPQHCFIWNTVDHSFSTTAGHTVNISVSSMFKMSLTILDMIFISCFSWSTITVCLRACTCVCALASEPACVPMCALPIYESHSISSSWSIKTPFNLNPVFCAILWNLNYKAQGLI